MAGRENESHLVGGAALLLLAVLLTVLLFLSAHRIPRPPALITAPQAPANRHERIRFDRFSATWQHDPAGERLRVSLRLRTDEPNGLQSYVFVVARRDTGKSGTWAIWPPQPPGPAITPAGHFHAGQPGRGYALRLERRWQRITALLPDTTGKGSYDTVVVFVVSPDGRIFLARPFAV